MQTVPTIGCPCPAFHPPRCNCSWLQSGAHPWQCVGVEPYRDIGLDPEGRVWQRYRLTPAGHYVRYLTFHPCKSGCDTCKAIRRLFRSVFPGLRKGRAELHAVETVSEEDNTDVIWGQTNVLINDIIQEGAVPFLHHTHRPMRPECDCLTRYLQFDKREQAASGKLLWLHHAHWQQVEEHHPGDLLHVPPVAYSVPADTTLRVTWKSKAWTEKYLGPTVVEHKATQTDNPSEVVPLAQSAFATIIATNTASEALPKPPAADPEPEWVRNYINVGELTWLISVHRPTAQRQLLGISEYRRQRRSRGHSHLEPAGERSASDVSIPDAHPSPPNVLP